MSLWQRLRKGLSRTKQQIAPDGERIDWEALEEALVLADCGMELAEALVAKAKAAKAPIEALRKAMRACFVAPPPLRWPGKAPFVLLVAGVNGVGKTTTIGKLALLWRREGKRVLLVAADTFRAAAVEQLAIWAERAGAELFRGASGADPAAVAFDGVARGKARAFDVVIVDTAGRVQTNEGLMRELAKVRRAVAKACEGAPHEAWIVVDGTTGQNAISQIERFSEAIAATGVVITKLDGAAKGGIALQIAHRFRLPIRFVGVGEGIEDLVPFDPDAFVEALLPERGHPAR